MKKTKRSVLTVVALVLAAAMLLFTTGCSSEAVGQLLQQYMEQNAQQQEYIGPDGDIYSLSMFDDLPKTYSDMDPLFWVAEGPSGNKVYFLGSIHCADNTAYRLPEKIINAYLESDALAVECDVIAYETDYQAQMSTMSYLMYTDGSTIDQHIDPELYEAMEKFYKDNPSETLSSLGYNLNTLKKFRPCMWQSVFDNIIVEKSGLDAELGIDSHLLKLAKAQGKKIIELESVEFQYGMISGFSDELNELLLAQYVQNDVDEQVEQLREMYEGWRIGDGSVLVDDEEPDYTGATQQEIEEYEALIEEYNSDMLYNRNDGMVEKAAAMIDGGQNVFYVVGAAHFVDERGIISQLRSRGYTVTQLGGLDDSACTGGSSDAHASSTASTTAQSTAVTTAATETNQQYEDMYDLYVALYDYYGGTTAPTGKTTTAKTSKTTTANNSDDDNSSTNNNGYGGWGFSD